MEFSCASFFQWSHSYFWRASLWSITSIAGNTATLRNIHETVAISCMRVCPCGIGCTKKTLYWRWHSFASLSAQLSFFSSCKYLFSPRLFPLSNSLSICVCRLLTSVQIKNFCAGKTTSERFSRKAKVVQESRTSSYLETSEADESHDDDSSLNISIADAMKTRDNSNRSCSTLLNCTDMWCRSFKPD